MDSRRTKHNPIVLVENARRGGSALSTHQVKDSEEKKPTITLDGTAVHEPSQPLAPPPRSNVKQTQSQATSAVPKKSNANQDGDGLSSEQGNTDFSREPNPFDRSFGQPSGETPEKQSLLPSVAALTSPAPLTQEGQSLGGYNFSNSLRSGPLSPAMIPGPVQAASGSGGGAAGSGGDYFDPNLRGTNYPGVTPNESSLRTGLTPGGGGSMFPAPSPNPTAFMQSLQNGAGAGTPSSLELPRSGATITATAPSSKSKHPLSNSTAIRDSNEPPPSNMDPSLQSATGQSSRFGEHDNDAANGLFLLAQATNGQSAGKQLNAPTQHNMQSSGLETSPRMSSGVLGQGSQAGSDHGGDGKSSRGKTTSTTKTKRASGGGRRKKDETSGGGGSASKPPSSKKPRLSEPSMALDDDSDEEQRQQVQQNQEDLKEDQYHQDGTKLTDEEKRKNFLERNRVAALKCRQRKKQWLQNLQGKVEMFSAENDNLNAQVRSLHDEIVGLKALLIQHKDCPVSQSQGIPGTYLQQHQQQAQPAIPGVQGYESHPGAYGMGIPNGHQVISPQRR